jgi:DNA primase
LQQQEAEQLLRKDYLQEKAIVRLLLEYGNMPFENTQTVAEYVRACLNTGDEFAHSHWKQLYQLYYSEWEASQQYPSEKFFTYHADALISKAAVEALHNPHEVSANWQESYGIFVPLRKDVYERETASTVSYFLLRKLKGVMNQYLQELQDPNITSQDAMVLMQVQKQIKETEKEILKNMTVVAVR